MFALIAIIAASLYLGAPALIAMGKWSLLVFFIGFLGLAVMSGVPIAFSFGLATSAYLLTTTSTPLTVVVGPDRRGDEQPHPARRAAIRPPGPTRREAPAWRESWWLSSPRCSVMFAPACPTFCLARFCSCLGISGSKTADMAAVAPVLFPEMRKRGMKDGELVSLLAASGAMSETIPPSIVLIAIASVTGVSIAALFTAGILPD